VFAFDVWLAVGAENTAVRRIVPETLNGMRVLVADDNAAAREILSAMLAPIGCDADIVVSGEQALSAIRQTDDGRPYGLVFMDWNMPGMDGIAATRAIKTDPTLKNIPLVVMITGFGRDDLRNLALQAGADGFLVKPVNQSSLVDTLVTLLAPESSAAVTEVMEHHGQWNLGGARLLLAEDNEINQQIALELLEGAGAKVEVAGSGRVVAEKVLAAPENFDLVLMDLQMPELDGYEATARLREDPRCAKLPIVAMTAHAMAEERERCLAAGMNDHISKPIDPDAMFRTIARWLPPSVAARMVDAGAAPRITGVDMLPDLPGVDVQAGIRRTGGNQQLYRQLLEKYVMGQSNVAQSLRAALAAGDRALAERLAHTAKGVSGNVGALEPQQAAAELEQAIRNKRESAELLDRFERALRAMTDMLRNALGTDAQTAPPAPISVDPGVARQAVEKLAAYLKSADGEAVDYLSEHVSELRAALAPGMFTVVAKAVNDYDFDGALEKLRAAESTTPITSTTGR
jgi:two-component system sensor histidine kinase/response regulator